MTANVAAGAPADAPTGIKATPPRRIRVGLPPKLLAPWAAVTWLFCTGLAVGAPKLLFWLHISPDAATPVVAVAVGFSGVLALLGGWSFIHLKRLQRGTRGRGRLLLLAFVVPASFVAAAAVFAFLWASLTPAQVNVLVQEVAYGDMLLGIDSGSLRTPFLVVASLAVALLVVLTGTMVSAWHLLPKRMRAVFWYTADGVVTLYVFSVATASVAYGRGWLIPETPWAPIAPPTVLALTLSAAAIASVVLWLVRSPAATAWTGRIVMLSSLAMGLRLLDFDVPSDQPERLVPAALFLGSISWLALRMHARWIPVLVDGIERLGFRPLVAARHLRTRKSDFLATISVLSIGAVMLASCALTLVLSVMGGFRNDLKRKILGNNAHVVVDRDHGTFGDWRETLDHVRELPHVVGAAPYVGGEVMVTSASNLAGAVLRGIDPDSVDAVVDLRRNLTRGSLDYLVEPERLLDLPAEESFGPLPLEIPRLDSLEVESNIPANAGAAEQPTEGTEEVPPTTGSSPLRTLEEMLAAPGDPSLAGPIDEVEGPDPAEPAREVLPGLVVGQELARSLRLYVGDEVNVVSPFGDLGPSGPMPKSRPFRVAGIFYSGMYEYDMKYMYSTVSAAQRFLNVGEEISGIEVKVQDLAQAPAVAETIRRSLPRQDLRVQDWQRLNRNLFGALELERLSMFIFLGLAILVAGFCVFATLTLMVQEKSPQVGILMAMGTHARTIVTVFLLEGLLIGLFGAEMGLGLGYVVCFGAEHFGIRMNPEVYYIDRLPVHIDPIEFGLVGATAVAVCVIATIFPAVLASKMRPVEALRYE